MGNSQALFDAIREGDIEVIEQMIAAEPSLVDAKGQNGLSAVMTALYYGEASIANLLIARGAELDIFEAAAAGKLQRVKELIERDPSLVNAFAGDGFQPLGLAAFFGRLDVVEWLLAHGAQVNSASRNKMQVMPLHSAVAGQHLAISRVLLEHGAEVNARQADDFTPLHEAAQNGQVEMVELLLAYGADKETRKSDGQTALSVATEKGYHQVVNLLRFPTGRK